MKILNDFYHFCWKPFYRKLIWFPNSTHLSIDLNFFFLIYEIIFLCKSKEYILTNFNCKDTKQLFFLLFLLHEKRSYKNLLIYRRNKECLSILWKLDFFFFTHFLNPVRLSRFFPTWTMSCITLLHNLQNLKYLGHGCFVYFF